MKIKVIEDACIGCGACAAICPDVFEIDAVATAKTEEIPADKESEVRDAIEGCPVSAIVEEA